MDGQTSYQTILTRQIEEGVRELERPAAGLVLSGFSAGLDIGFGPLLMGVVLTLGAGEWGHGVREIAAANAYAVGFIFVVMARSELFTEHTTLAVLPVLDGQATVAKLARLWGLVYVANIVGGVIFATVIAVLLPTMGVVDPAVFGDIATRVAGHPWPLLVAAAVLTGWLMGLLSWLVAASQETLSRTFFVWLVATAIGLAGLPHCIAGTVEVMLGVVATHDIGLAEFARFLVASTVGNALGGAVFVALLKYSHVMRGGDPVNIGGDGPTSE